MSSLMSRLVQQRHHRWARELMLLVAGPEIYPQTEIGDRLQLKHRAQGVVIQLNTQIGDRVTIYHQVTIGRQDVITSVDFEPRVAIEDDAVLCAGAKILAPAPGLTVGRGSVVAANAVLLQSTGEWEIWAGVPARLVGKRDPDDLRALID